MDLKCEARGLWGASVDVDGHVYVIGPSGLVTGVAAEHAAVLLGSVDWRPVKPQTRPTPFPPALRVPAAKKEDEPKPVLPVLQPSAETKTVEKTGKTKKD